MSRAYAARAGFDLPLLVAGSAAFSISTLFSAMKPVLIARFAEEAGDPTTLAGLAAAMPFVGGAASSILLPSVLRRLDAGAAVIGFGICLALVEAANAVWFALVPLLLTGQFIAGVCGGVLLGLASQHIAVSRRSEQSFGIVDMIGVLMMSAMIAMVGAAVGAAGLRGGFLTASGLCAMFAVIMIAARRSLSQVNVGGIVTPSVPLRVGWRGVAIIAMGVTFVTFSGLGFAFMVTAARALGMTYENAGFAIGLILFFSATGCLAGGWCAARLGAKAPLLAAFALCAVGWHVALHAHSQAVFLLALGPAIFALQFAFPILLALPGAMDVEGRLAAIAAPIIVSGFAWAAILAGTLVARWGPASLPVATEIGMIMCAALLIVSTERHFRDESGKPQVG